MWSGLSQLIARRLVKPVLYKEVYCGLEDIVRAMTDVENRKVWGKAIVHIAMELKSNI